MIANRDATKTLQKVLSSGPAELRVPAAHAAIMASALVAKEGNASVARELLESVAKALPTSHLAKVAQEQIAALKKKPGK
jgi:TolA-binding protein